MPIVPISNQHIASSANQSQETFAIPVSMTFVYENDSFSDFGIEWKKFHSFQKYM